MNLVKAMTAISLSLIIFGSHASDARIIGRRRGASATGSHGEYTPTDYSTEKRYSFDGRKLSLQEIAQMRADAMAQRQTMTHGIHALANVPAAPIAEGIGVSSSNDYRRVSTCICGSTVVADAWCRSRNGMTYRVRFWK